MSTENNVTFDDSKFKIKSRAIFGRPEVPNIIKFLVNKKIVKNEKQAVILVFILFIIFIALTVYLFRTSIISEPAQIDPQFITNSK